MIKNFLRSGMCDFEELHKGIMLKQDRLLANYKQKLEEQTSKVIPECQKNSPVGVALRSRRICCHEAPS